MRQPKSFLDLPLDPLERADVTLLRLPFEGTVSYSKGTAQAPDTIIAASTQIELWDEELNFDLNKVCFHTADPVDHLADESPASYLKKLLSVAHQLHQEQPEALVIGIGGEHSVTPPLVRAVARHQDDLSDMTIVQFDAHSDLRDEFEGTTASHASAMRRVVEHGARVIAIGIRSSDRDEYRYGVESGLVKTFHAQALAVDPAIDRGLRDLLQSLSGNVYLTIDIDCLDVQYCPATGTPQPGGLGWWQLLSYLRCLLHDNQSSALLGCDLVETAPQPGTRVNEFTAAKLLSKVVAYHFANPSRKRGF